MKHGYTEYVASRFHRKLLPHYLGSWMPDGGGKGGFSEMLYKPTCHRIVTFQEILVWLTRGGRKSTSFVSYDLTFLKMCLIRIWYRCFAQTFLAGLMSLQNNFCPNLYFSARGTNLLSYNAGVGLLTSYFEPCGWQMSPLRLEVIRGLKCNQWRK